MAENTPVGEGKTPLQRTAARPSFVVCPVCGIPAKGASYGIHDECATVGFMKNLAGDLIDLALGRRPVVNPPQAAQEFIKARASGGAGKYTKKRVEVIKEAEFRVIDKKDERGYDEKN